MENDLTALPEIGPVVAGQLAAVGLGTPDQFRAVGAREAFRRIKEQLDPGACLNLLYGLEAATCGIRATELPPETKTELKQWKKALDKPDV